MYEIIKKALPSADPTKHANLVSIKQAYWFIHLFFWRLD